MNDLRIIKNIEPYEISLVWHPANPACGFILNKDDVHEVQASTAME